MPPPSPSPESGGVAPSPLASPAASSPGPESTISLRLKHVAQLAAPRGVVLVDELTGKGAVYSLDVCGQTYYYQTHESCSLDYSVLSHIGPLLADLATERAAQGTAQEREIHKQRARRLMAEVARVTLDLASQRIISKDFERAKPAALRCLRMLVALHGESAPELVPAYLVMAEAALGSGAADKAEEFLSMSSFVLSKQQQLQERFHAGAPSAAADASSSAAAAGLHGGAAAASHGGVAATMVAEEAAAAAAAAELAAGAMRSRLHRNFGRLFAAQGNLPAAVGAFSHDILHCARSTGPESIEASPGYFNLGKVFALMGNGDAALACFDKVVECWHMHLTGRRSAVARLVASLQERGPDVGAGSAALAPPRPLSAIEAAEGLEILAAVSSAREAKFGSEVSVAEVRLTAALLLHATNEGHRAGPLIAAALATFREALPPGHPLVLAAEQLEAKVEAGSARLS